MVYIVFGNRDTKIFVYKSTSVTIGWERYCELQNYIDMCVCMSACVHMCVSMRTCAHALQTKHDLINHVYCLY